MGGKPRLSCSRSLRLVTAVTVLWWGFVGLRPARAAEAVLVGAGDIAECKKAYDSATARLIASIGGTVFTLGDNVYKTGSEKQFDSCYGPTWGRFKGRTRPALGNHEYLTKGADGHFDYYGKAAGPRGKGWYSYDVGSWHVIVLNSNCNKVGCGPDSEQVRWLRSDLAEHDNKCTLAYFHHPRFSSTGKHGNEPQVAPFWEALYDSGADVVLSGHTHAYERFAPQTPGGKADSSHGIRQFVVGTGGAALYRFGSTRPNSQVRNAKTHGVLKLTLKSDSYDWRFIPIDSKSFSDTGHGGCHGRP
jgi:acid phosphatase type 7